MSEKNQLPPKKLVATAAGIGLCFVAIKYRSLVFNKIKIIANYKNPIRNQDIRVIDTVHECRTVMKNIKSYGLLSIFLLFETIISLTLN